MHGEITRDEIIAWHVERGAEVTEAGKLTLIALTRFAGNGTEVEIHAVRIADTGTDLPKLGEAMETIATRDARGLGGVNLYQLAAVYGTTGKPSRFLPFRRAGALTSGAGPGGGLQTEGPTPTGIVGTGQRWGELAIQQAGAKDVLITNVMGQLIDKLVTRLETSEKRSDERWLALHNSYTAMMDMSMKMQLRALGIEAAKKILPILPAGLSTLTGSDDLVPQRLVEESVFDAIVERVPPETFPEALAALSNTLGGAGDAGPIMAILTDQLARARKRKAARDLENGGPVSYQIGERDAAGQVRRALRGGEPPKTEEDLAAERVAAGLAAKANGKAEANAPKADDTGDAVIDRLLAAAGPMADTMLDGLAAQDPELAKRMRARLTADAKGDGAKS